MTKKKESVKSAGRPKTATKPEEKQANEPKSSTKGLPKRLKTWHF